MARTSTAAMERGRAEAVRRMASPSAVVVDDCGCQHSGGCTVACAHHRRWPAWGMIHNGPAREAAVEVALAKWRRRRPTMAVEVVVRMRPVTATGHEGEVEFEAAVVGSDELSAYGDSADEAVMRLTALLKRTGRPFSLTVVRRTGRRRGHVAPDAAARREHRSRMAGRTARRSRRSTMERNTAHKVASLAELVKHAAAAKAEHAPATTKSVEPKSGTPKATHTTTAKAAKPAPKAAKKGKATMTKHSTKAHEAKSTPKAKHVEPKAAVEKPKAEKAPKATAHTERVHDDSKVLDFINAHPEITSWVACMKAASAAKCGCNYKRFRDLFKAARGDSASTGRKPKAPKAEAAPKAEKPARVLAVLPTRPKAPKATGSTLAVTGLSPADVDEFIADTVNRLAYRIVTAATGRSGSSINEVLEAALSEALAARKSA